MYEFVQLYVCAAASFGVVGILAIVFLLAKISNNTSATCWQLQEIKDLLKAKK